MKILFISSGNNKSGISPIVKAQGNSIISQGISLDFYTIKGTGIIGYLKNVIPLRKFLKKNNYNILHAHYGFSGFIMLLAKRNEKTIISFMGSDLLNINQNNLIIKFFSRLNLLLNQLLARYVYDFVIIKSQQMSELLNRTSNKAVIPNGVNLELFNPIPKEEARDYLKWDISKKIGLFSSDPDRPEKNFNLAKQALQIVNIKDLEIVPLRNIDQEKLRFYYSAADFLLLTSNHEGSPNVIKEAMACNCPIVATDVGDIRSIIGITNGCHITSFDPHEIATKIYEVLNFSDRPKGRQRLLDLNLDSNQVALNIISIYSSILNK